jgi:NADH-ubiquinone oxidoreductase chain 1
MFDSFIDLLRWQINASGLNPENEYFLLIMLSFISVTILRYTIALLAIAFYTLLERKLLGYYQLRKGPNKVSIIGITQPFADALKLFLKEQTMPTIINKYIFFIAPIIALSLTLLL